MATRVFAAVVPVPLRSNNSRVSEALCNLQIESHILAVKRRREAARPRMAQTHVISPKDVLKLTFYKVFKHPSCGFNFIIIWYGRTVGSAFSGHGFDSRLRATFECMNMSDQKANNKFKKWTFLLDSIWVSLSNHRTGSAFRD